MKVDKRLVVLLLAGRPNRLGVVGGIHHIVEIGDAAGGQRYQWNRHLGIMDTGCGDERADGDIAVSHIEMQLVAAPPFGLPAATLFPADYCNGSRSIAPNTPEFVLLGAWSYRACLPRADSLKVVLGVKGPLRRAYRRAPDSSGPLWSFGLYGEDNVI